MTPANVQKMVDHLARAVQVAESFLNLMLRRQDDMNHEPEPEGFFAHLHGDDLDAEVAARDLSDDLAELEGERDRAERKYASARELLVEIKRWLGNVPGDVPTVTYWHTRIAKRLERLDRT